MLERIRNLIKVDRKKSKGSPDQQQQQPSAKRTKNSIDKLQRRYPMTSGSDMADPETLEQNYQAIEEEMKKLRPRDRVLLPLMKATFPERWLFVRKEATCVKEITDKFSCFKFPAIVSVCCYICWYRTWENFGGEKFW